MTMKASRLFMPTIKPYPSERRRNQTVAHEIADIQIYLAALSDRLGIDIGPAVAKNMKLDVEIHPADLARGMAVEYRKLN